MRAILFLWLLASTSAMAATVTLAWDASPSPTVSQYRLYWGSQTQAYTNVVAAQSLTTTISNLTVGVTYYFAVTARDSAGMESVFSNEVQYTVPKPPKPKRPRKPSPPTNMRFIDEL